MTRFRAECSAARQEVGFAEEDGDEDRLDAAEEWLAELQGRCPHPGRDEIGWCTECGDAA